MRECKWRVAVAKCQWHVVWCSQAGDRTISRHMTNHLTPATVRDIVDSALDVINDQTGIRFNKFLTKDAEKRVAEAIELALLHSNLTA